MAVSADYEREIVTRVVRQAIAKVLPYLVIEDISGDRSLKDHGADSVDRIEIILSIMSQLGIDEPVSNFSNIPNVDSLVDYLCKVRRT